MNTDSIYEVFKTCSGISIDTRSISNGDLFVAIKGKRFDANRLVEEAFSNGASFAVVDNVAYKTRDSVIVAPQGGIAVLQELAKKHVNTLRAKVIAITGSNGKTTTKELVSKVLSKKYNIIFTSGNYNNHIGVPLSLLKIKQTTQLAVIEMGANHLREIENLCQIAQPEFAYITSFGKAHLEGFGSLQGVIKAKSELYDYTKSNHGLIFYNADDPVQFEKCNSYRKTISFSVNNNEASDYKIQVDSKDGIIQVFFEGHTINTQLTGGYNASNIGAALTIGKYFKISILEMKSAIESYQPNNRSQVLVSGSNKIIADEYNANPSSMEVALENLSKVTGNKMAILGDMFELGEYTEAEHQRIADLAKKMNLNILLVGAFFSNVKTDFSRFKSVELLKKHLKENYPKGMTILVKGSRGMTLEKVIEFLQKKS